MLAANGFDLLATILLTVTVILVAFFDLRERRIPNNIVFPAALTGLVLNGLRGWAGLWFGGKGLLVGFGLLFIPYLFRVMGAGDVKFLAAIGSFVGVSGVVRVLLLGLLIYPLLAMVFMIQQRKVKLTIRRFGILTSRFFGVLIPQFRLYAERLKAFDDEEIDSATSPFGLTISVGTLIALYTTFLA